MAHDMTPAAQARGNGWRMARWGGAALLLLAPWIAMRFTAEVDWTGFDFLVFGTLLLAACGAYELVLLATRRHAYRLLAAGAIALAFLLVWAQLAVGIVGGN